MYAKLSLIGDIAHYFLLFSIKKHFFVYNQNLVTMITVGDVLVLLSDIRSSEALTDSRRYIKSGTPVKVLDVHRNGRITVFAESYNCTLDLPKYFFSDGVMTDNS